MISLLLASTSENEVSAPAINVEVAAASGETASGAAGSETHEGSAAFSPPTIYSERIGSIGGFELRNTLLMSWIAIVLLSLVAIIFAKNYTKRIVPNRFQLLIESVIEGLYDFFHAVTQNEKETKQFLAICGTIFIFIVLSNWMGLIPGVGSIGFWEEEEGRKLLIPLLRSTYSDVNMTLAIAIISVVMTQVYGIKNLGFFSYCGKFFVNPLRDPIGCFVGVLELVSEFAKVVSFTFRLYGNIFAGEVLLAVIGFLVPYLAPLPFYGLELFVGLVQGLVFALLTLVFFKMGSTGHGDHDVHLSSSHTP